MKQKRTLALFITENIDDSYLKDYDELRGLDLDSLQTHILEILVKFEEEKEGA